MIYQTLNVRFEQDLCWLQLHRPEANNTINDQLIDECRQVDNLANITRYIQTGQFPWEA